MSEGREIEVRLTEHPTAHEAIQHLSCSGDDRAITMGGRFYSLTQADAEKLEWLGAAFAYLFDRDGQIVTVPAKSD